MRRVLRVVAFCMMRAVMGRKGSRSMWTMYSRWPVLVTGLILHSPPWAATLSTLDLGAAVEDQESRIQNPESRIQNLESRIQN